MEDRKEIENVLAIVNLMPFRIIVKLLEMDIARYRADSSDKNESSIVSTCMMILTKETLKKELSPSEMLDEMERMADLQKLNKEFDNLTKSKDEKDN
jgi:hypothetical protein